MTLSSTAGAPHAEVGEKPVFWELLWRSAGIQAVALLIIADVLRGRQPQLGASPDELHAFYAGHEAQILVAAAITGLAVLNLLWFAAAVRTTLADAGRDGWGAAATASSAAFGSMFLIVTAIGAALAHGIAGSESAALESSANDISWSLLVLLSFPRAMFIMSMAFGLWRAQLISNGLFAVGVAFVVLGVLAGTTWTTGIYWAPDGHFSRGAATTLLPAWVVIVSWVLLSRRSGARGGW